MSFTVSGLAAMDIGAWFSGVETKGDMKDDTAVSAAWRRQLHRKTLVE